MCRIDPYHSTARGEPNLSVSALDSSVQGAQLKRKPRQSFSRAKMLTFDLIRRVLQRLRDFGAADVKNATQSIEPKVSVGRFHNSRDSTKQLTIRRFDVVE